MIVTFKRYHYKNFGVELDKAKQVAAYAVTNKNSKKLLTSRLVTNIGLPSAISNQVLRKYGRGTIKEAKNVNLVIPGQGIRYSPAESLITVIPLKHSFKFNFGKPIIKINQIEIDDRRVYISASLHQPVPVPVAARDIVSVDLNCGVGRHVAVMACLKTKKTAFINKQGPNTRKRYFKKRQAAKESGSIHMIKNIRDRESRILKDMDHKISHQIVEYAKVHSCKVVMEDLKGIRMGKDSGQKNKNLNRLVNCWSFYRLQTFVEYKCQAAGLPFIKVKPHFTSQLCSYCGKLGTRDGPAFTCNSPLCLHNGKRKNSDVNAAWNIGYRYLGTI